MTKAALREQRRAERIARRNRQRMILGVIIALVIVVIGIFIYRDYKSRTATTSSGLYPIGTLDTTPPTPSANAVTTASGLIYEDLQVGDGATATTGNTATVNYIGWLADGTSFDSNLKSSFSFTLGSGQVIPGWDEGVQGMKLNGTRLLVIPPSLAYGSTANGPIPANSTLTFEVQLVSLK
jgi:FKBP-type peptidyl-prolyl cis-trans isomerase FkpA